MSAAETFLARWLRRKREAAQAADAAIDQASPAEPTVAAISDGSVERPAAAGVPPALPFDPTSLPPIDSITAETDIRAFLAPGVPPELAREALRRAWAADPKIRDFVGLAENAWDYHAPGSIPGFGPLEMTDELKRMVEQILGDAGDAERSPVTSEPNQAHIKDNEQASLPVPNASENTTASEAESGVPPTRSVTSRHGDQSPHAEDRGAATQNPRPKNAENEGLQTIVRRLHGGAIPKL